MKFGPIPVAEAVGAVLAHSIAINGRRLRKGYVLAPDDITMLRDAGIAEVVVAKLARADLDENAAAARLTESLIVSGVEAGPAATGRVNLHAQAAGVLTVDAAIIDGINAIDPAITIATLPHHAAVEAGQMVATLKIIPFAVDGGLVEQAAKVGRTGGAFAVHPYRAKRVAMIQTTLPGVKDSVLAKTARVTEARLGRSGSKLIAEQRTAHTAEAVANAIASLQAGSDVVLVFGASAVSDADDVIPAAIRLAGGEVVRVGMPVDPGNLLVLGRLDGKPVIGAPGCARSPRENGFDWVLDRLLAGLDVTGRDIAGMGVGGLLMEIPTRPQPREASSAAGAQEVHAIVLAAGRSSRMGGPNKLLARFAGEPLIRRTAERALASGVKGAVVVTGHQAARVREALDGIDMRVVHNPDFATGLSSSLKAGVAALPVSATGALIVLGDMPALSSADLDRLIDAFRKAGGTSVVRATHDGKRGNPVLLPRALFARVAQLEGDTGARHLVESGALPVIDVEIGEGAAIDVDTPDALASAGGVLQG